jgi:hypothetical protein
MDFGPAVLVSVPNLPTGELLVDASRVFHGNINGAGDFWITQPSPAPPRSSMCPLQHHLRLTYTELSSYPTKAARIQLARLTQSLQTWFE